MRIEIALSLRHEEASVALVRRSVSAILEQAGISSDCRSEVELVLSEACTNVVAHTVGGEDGYRVVVALEEECLTVDVIDSGPGVVPGTLDDRMPHPWADQGRGTALIAAFTDGAHFDTIASGGTIMRMTKQLTRAAGQPFWQRQAPEPTVHCHQRPSS